MLTKISSSSAESKTTYFILNIIPAILVGFLSPTEFYEVQNTGRGSHKDVESEIPNRKGERNP